MTGCVGCFMKLLVCCILLYFVTLSGFYMKQLARATIKLHLSQNLKNCGSIRQPVKPGTISEVLKVPSCIKAPDYAMDGVPRSQSIVNSSLQPNVDIQRMRVAGRIARRVLDSAIRMVKPGVTTNDIDMHVHNEVIKHNSYPSPLNYHGYPKSVCTSVNEIVCHGIPDSTVLIDGDIVNVDVTIFHDGVHGDCSETVCVGEVSALARDLIATTHGALMAAVEYCAPGRPYSGIGGVIEDFVASSGRSYSSCRPFCGHGIGRVFHAHPNILHYRNKEWMGVMQPGHTFTIEPMLCEGSAECIIWPDGWTAATADGGLSAQFEHTLLVTERGVEILTDKIATSPPFAWAEEER